jgi:Sulfotransferase domain
VGGQTARTSVGRARRIALHRGVSAVVQDTFEAYLERFRRPGQVLLPPPARRRRLRGRVKARMREAAVGYGKYGLLWLAGRNPARRRLLPDFLLVGGAKCGTTSLYDWICRHPQVARASWKGIHFFDYNYHRRTDWYCSHFAQVSERERFERELGIPLLTGEGSASYLSHRWAPERAARVVPRAKVIVVFRNPVDRAYSHFQMSRREGLETFETFEEAIAWEEERLRPELARIERSRRDSWLPYGVWSYLHRGYYAYHLQRWLDHFPGHQFLFLRAETMFVDPYSALEAIDDFLELPPHRPAELPHLLGGGSYAPMSGETRARLSEHFRPHNDRLCELTGIDFAWD